MALGDGTRFLQIWPCVHGGFGGSNSVAQQDPIRDAHEDRSIATDRDLHVGIHRLEQSPSQGGGTQASTGFPGEGRRWPRPSELEDKDRGKRSRSDTSRLEHGRGDEHEETWASSSSSSSWPSLFDQGDMCEEMKVYPGGGGGGCDGVTCGGGRKM
ncbi:unnamed protein product [Urochloa humidicola]